MYGLAVVVSSGRPATTIWSILVQTRTAAFGRRTGEPAKPRSARNLAASEPSSGWRPVLSLPFFSEQNASDALSTSSKPRIFSSLAVLEFDSGLAVRVALHTTRVRFS